MATAQPASSKDEGVAAMTKAYPDYQLPVILDFGMQAAAEGRFYPRSRRLSSTKTPEPRGKPAIHPVPRLHRRVTSGSASAVPAQRW
jgi:hypothetical protein